MRHKLSLPSPSMAVSITALVVALGGTSYAAVSISGSDIKNNTITSADVKNNSLTGRDIKNSSLTGSDIKNRSLTSADFKLGQLPSGKNGTNGTNGAAGAKGDTGPQGPAGAGRWVLVNRDGQIEAASDNGFKVRYAYNVATDPTDPPAPAGARNNVYIDANEDLTDNGIVSTIALQNQVDQGGMAGAAGIDPAADGNPEFSGEITASRCAVGSAANPPVVVACAPGGLGTPTTTNTPEYFVVSPRMSDGTGTLAGDPAGVTPAQINGTRKRFYVVISGNSPQFGAFGTPFSPAG